MSPTTLTVPRFAGLTGAIVAALFTALFAMKLTALFTAKLALKPPLLFPSPRIHSGQSIALGPLPAAAGDFGPSFDHTSMETYPHGLPFALLERDFKSVSSFLCANSVLPTFRRRFPE